MLYYLIYKINIKFKGELLKYSRINKVCMTYTYIKVNLKNEMLNNNKEKIKLLLINLWGINDYPIKLSNTLFDIAWNNAEKDTTLITNKEFKTTVYKEGLTLIKLTELCKEIYMNKEISNSFNIKEILIKLNNLELKGSVSIVRSNNNREVIQWEYTLETEKLLDNWDSLSINNTLKSVKILDINLMNPILKEYNYQEQESWSINDKYISCYIGSNS